MTGKSVTDQNIKFATQLANSLQYQKDHNLLMYIITYYINGKVCGFRRIRYSDLDENSTTTYTLIPSINCCHRTF